MKLFTLLSLVLMSANAFAVINTITLKTDIEVVLDDPYHSELGYIEITKDMTRARKNEVRNCTVLIESYGGPVIPKGTLFVVKSESYSQHRVAPADYSRMVKIKASALDIDLEINCIGNKKNGFSPVFTNAELEKAFQIEFKFN